MRYATSDNDIDISKLRKEKMTIYVQIPDADKKRLSPVLTLFWAQLIQLLSQREPDVCKEPYSVLALMDEFGNMAKIDKLKDGMSFLRSYRVRCVIIVQYLGQITSIYGQHDAKGFFNSKVKVTFALNDLNDAKFFSESLGKKTVRVRSHSFSSGSGDQGGSTSENYNYQSRALLTPDEIMQFDANKGMILMESRYPIKFKKCYWFNDGQMMRWIAYENLGKIL